MADIQVTLNIPSHLYQLAQQVAKLTQRPITEVLVESIVREDIKGGSTSEDNDIARERAAYMRLHSMLLEKYPGQHVAIYGGQLVDHDLDDVALSLRIYQRFPNDFVWIAPVKQEPLEEWVVHSPRFESLEN